MERPLTGWIWIQEEDDGTRENRIVYFRRQLQLSEVPEALWIRISADAKYKLYINDQLVNVGPQKGDSSLHYYDSLDVADWLKEGNNVLVVQVLAIPNNHNKGNHGFHRTDCPGLYLDCEMEIDGERILSGDQIWQYKVSQVKLNPESPFFAPLHFIETVEAMADFCGMYEDGFDEKDWQSARPREGFELPAILRPNHMCQRQIPLLYLKEQNLTEVICVREGSIGASDWHKMIADGSSVTIPPHTVEVVEFTAGEETTGYLKLAMSQGSGARIEVLTSEAYAYEPAGSQGPMKLPVKGDRTDWQGGRLYGFTDHYKPTGMGTVDRQEIYEPFWFRTFRYIQLRIETGDEPLSLHQMNYLRTGYPLDVQSKVESSDTSLKGIWEISERTLKLCMHETYEDCPFYEQLQYAMDSRSQILYTYASAADDRLARQCMDDFRRATRNDGMINCSYPNYETNVIPGFAIYYIGMVYDHMMYFGDRKLVMEHLPTIFGILNFFRSHLDERGLVDKVGGPIFVEKYWSFIDWTPQWSSTAGVPQATKEGPLTMESLLYIMGLQYARDLLDYVGYEEMAKSFGNEAKVLQKAVNDHCRGNNGMYTDGPGLEHYSQHTQVFAILTDTISTCEGAAYLTLTLEYPEDYAQCSVAMMFYLFRALEKCDLYDRTNGLWDLWREMLVKNLTTCEEDSITSRSDCHAWGALALYELPSVTLGVRPSKPGYSEISINPLPAGLSWAKGQVVTPKGMVEVEWHVTQTFIKGKVRLPKGVQLKMSQRRDLELIEE